MTVRWGICGTGRIATKMVGQLAQIGDAEVVAVASRTSGRAQHFADRHGIDRAHGSYAALAGDNEIDVVYVATTQEGHHDTVVCLLRAGHNVLCEKPLAMTEAQVVSMTDVARLEGRFLMEAMWARFSDAWVLARELVRQGRIGDAVQLRADLSVNIAAEARATHRLWDPARGGGALMDVGIYPINLSAFLFGEPDRVDAAGVLAEPGLDRRVTALLDHPGGEVSVLTAALDHDGGADARISGTEGSITLQARMHASPGLVVESGGEVRAIDLDLPGLGIQIPEVHRCLAEGLLESPVMSWDESAAVHRTADRIRDRIGLRFPADES